MKVNRSAAYTCTKDALKRSSQGEECGPDHGHAEEANLTFLSSFGVVLGCIN